MTPPIIRTNLFDKLNKKTISMTGSFLFSTSFLQRRKFTCHIADDETKTTILKMTMLSKSWKTLTKSIKERKTFKITSILCLEDLKNYELFISPYHKVSDQKLSLLRDEDIDGTFDTGKLKKWTKIIPKRRRKSNSCYLQILKKSTCQLDDNDSSSEHEKKVGLEVLYLTKIIKRNNYGINNIDEEKKIFKIQYLLLGSKQFYVKIRNHCINIMNRELK
ncbi:hypothetical protein U3516DRAFT_742131 [Neocallimastix sp. 'constans']